MQHFGERDQGPASEAEGEGATALVSGRLRSMLLKLGISTAVGLICGLTLFEFLPTQYTAQTTLKVEGGSDAAVASASEMLRSKTSLDNLVKALNLGADIAEPSAIRIVSDIVTGRENTLAQVERNFRESLGKAISVQYHQATKQATISVTGAQAAQAAKTANMLAQTFSGEISQARSEMTQPIVEKLRQTLERAEATLSGYVEKTGRQKVAELKGFAARTEQLATDLAEAETELGQIKQKVAEASAMKIADVLSKPLPDALEYTSLDYQRQRHTEAKLLVDQLSASLGPRHPKLLAAQGALSEVRNGIQDALKQLVASLRQQEMASVKLIAELKAKQKAEPQDKDFADSAARLNTLEAAVREARENYLAAQQRAETRPALLAAKAEVIAPATAAAAIRTGRTLEELAAGGTLAGLGLGALLIFVTKRKIEDEFELEGGELAQDDSSYVAPTIGAALIEGDAGDRVRDEEDDDLYFDDDQQQAKQPTYAEAANDVPLGDQIRELLMANRRPASEALPPLVAAVASGGLKGAPAGVSRLSMEDRQKAEELRELRRHMADLRERVAVHSASRVGRRR
jgi:uncharacterized protein involved in exopolysaccharide biosynthesis